MQGITHKTKMTAAAVLLFALVALTNSGAKAEITDGDSINIGEYRTITSKILGEERTIAVYLPYGYDESEDVYPVLYLLGGESKYRLMKVAATIEELEGAGKMPPMIVIGTDEPNATRDYFPQPLDNRPGSGQAETFRRFLGEELIPWVTNEYRVADYRVLYGASNAGMFTIYTMLTEPDLFSAYLTASPSVGWFPEYMQQLARAAFDSDGGLPTTLYMNYATDDLERIVLNGLPEFVALCDSAAPANFRWKNDVIDNGGHVPYISEYYGLSFIFHDWQYPRENLPADGLTGLQLHYVLLSEKYGFPVRIPSDLLVDLGMNSYRDSNWTAALEVFQAYAREHPTSVRAWYLTGNAQLQLGDTAQARASFEEALKIDPQFRQAREKLEQIGDIHR